ncbi:MAG: UDP-N-acetylglucosamine--N-acetylmuramyl-(pentapeptide) pyrophosphoryl-undecaprenol N-acetylglucosamine transferase [Planctomycetota bacterium]
MTRILFVGGGTGGHIRPALTICREIERRRPGTRSLFLVSGRGVETEFFAGGREDVVPLFPQWTSRPPPWRIDAYLAAWLRARSERRGLDPQVTVLLGGYVAALGLAGRSRRHPCVLLESNALPGSTARYLARRATLTLLQWESARARLPDPSRGIVTGIPVDPKVGQADRAEARKSLGLDPARHTLLVLGGSQGSLAVNRLVLEALRRLAPSFAAWQVLHLTGRAHAPSVESEGRALATPVLVLPFLERMDLAYGAADLVVSRAGGMAVAELAQAGVPSILIPYPFHKDQHQRANGRELETRGAAVVVEQGPGEEERVASALGELVSDTAKRLRMADAARALRRERVLEESLGAILGLVEDGGGSGT